MRAVHLWALALALLLSACEVEDFALRPVEGNRPVRAVATTNFVTDLVQQIGGERVQVTGLMGAGVDPHLYKASAGDVRKLTQADVVFYGGLFLEGKLVELFEKMPKAMAITDAIPRGLLIAPEGGFEGTYTYDPHVWFDVSLWAYTAEAVREGLSKVDPAGAGYYAERTRQYQARLRALDAWAKEEIGRIPQAQRVMVTAHDAFGYFGRRYGLEVRGLTVAYHEKPVLWDVDLSIPEGQLCAIVGPNGAGKSTLIKAVLGLIPKASGTVQFFGQPLEAARRRIGYVPQRSSVDWDFPTNALDVVLMGLYGRLGWFRRPGKAEREGLLAGDPNGLRLTARGAALAGERP